MRTITAAWFLPVGLAAVLATVTNVSGLAYQAPSSSPADGSQVPGPPGADAGASSPGTSAPSQSPDVATPRPAARASIPPRSPARYGPVQQTYSTAWPYLDITPARRSAYGGTGSAAANLPLPPTGQAGVNRYPTPFGAQGGGSSFTSQAAIGAMSGSRPAASPKPFSDYSRTSGISPYMNLFRTDNNLGRVDNYNTLVRPLLQQRQMNRQTQLDVRSLRSGSGAQGSQLQELNRRTDVLQGTSGQNRFKSYFDYYPKLNR
jgi:hypothetical protein